MSNMHVVTSVIENSNNMMIAWLHFTTPAAVLCCQPDISGFEGKSVKDSDIVIKTAIAFDASAYTGPPQKPPIIEPVPNFSRPITPVKEHISEAASSPSVAKKRKSSTDLIDLTEDEDCGGEDPAKLASSVPKQVGTRTFYFIPSSIPVNEALMTIKQMHNIHPVNAPVTVAAPTNTTPALCNCIKTDSSLQHPAPLPGNDPLQPLTDCELVLPAPSVTVQKAATDGVLLTWNMADVSGCDKVLKYQLFAYPEGSQKPHSGLWKKVGDIDPLPLPMSCELTNFNAGRIYHFAMRAVNIHGHYGPFSSPHSILL